MKQIKNILIILLISFVFPSMQIAQEQSSNIYENYFKEVDAAAGWLREKTFGATPRLMIVLTAGVDGPEDLLQEKHVISAAQIPYFPKATVEGHEGQLIFGKLDGVDIVLLKGRFHFYEGHSAQKVVFPYFVFHKMGVHSLITVNAVGGIRKDLDPGDIMLVTDHVNLLPDNPLRGLAFQNRKENQFTSMIDAYHSQYQSLAKKIAESLKISLKEGVYAAAMGPCYDTKAEVVAYRSMGIDTIGMSTVFEVIACNFLGIKVLAFNGIANPAADRHMSTMNHKEVLEAMSAMAPGLSSLITQCAKNIIVKERIR